MIQSFSTKEQDFKLLTGSRLFVIQNEHLNGEIRNTVGLSFSAGIEYKIKKISKDLGTQPKSVKNCFSE